MQESYDIKGSIEVPKARCSNKSQTKDCFQESYIDDWTIPKEEWAWKQ